jgi:hypothetical protein
MMRLGQMIAGCLVAMASSSAAQTAVVARAGERSPEGLAYSSFLGVGLGAGGDVALLATTTGVFRRVIRGDAVEAEGVFLPGSSIDGREVIGTGAPALAPNGCVVAVVSFADGSDAIYRRCGAALERVAGVGDAVGPHTITSLETSVVTSGGGYVAFLARLNDGRVALVRGGLGPLTEITRTGNPSPAGGTISSLRVLGVRTDGTVGFGATVVDGRDGLFEGSSVGVRKVIVEGDGGGKGPVDAIDGASMNADGVFAFLGTLDDPAGTRGIFRADARPPLPQVAQLVAVDDVAPGVKRGTFGRFPSSLVPSINADGEVAFRVTLGGDATGAGVFVVDGTGAVRKIVTTREERKEEDVGTLTRLRDPVLADDGSVLVVSTPPNEGVGLFVSRDDVVTPLLRFGAKADVGTDEQQFRFVSPSVVATAEDAVFLGQHDVLVAIGPGGGARVVAQLGAESPVGGTFAEIDVPAVGADGRIAFRGEVLDGKTGQGIFADDGTGVRAVAKAGRGAPGAGRFRDFPAAVTDSGASVEIADTRVGFLASLFDTNAFEGIFLKRKTRDAGKSLARTNGRAPGGGRYVSIDLPSVLDPKHYAFSGLVRDDATRQGIFWRDGGKTRIVTRQGLDTGTRLRGRFQAFSAPELALGGLVFRADVSPADRDGIFLALDTRRGLLLASGDSDGSGENMRTLDRPVWVGNSVVFSGSLSGVPSLRGLFRVTPDGLPALEDPPLPVQTLAREGWEAPEGGTLVDVRPPASDGVDSLVAIARVENGPAYQVVLRLRLDAPASP